MSTKFRKSVIPVAGDNTRMLPEAFVRPFTEIQAGTNCQLL